MDALDEAAAAQFQTVHTDLQNGVWNTGQLGARGFVVEEPVNAEEQTAQDSIKRYTDRYLPRRKIGRTAADFEFEPLFLPQELYKAVGLTVENGTDHKPVKSETKVADIERLVRQNGQETEKETKDEENDDEPEAEEEEDEFEEMDDDDYNAEKYFDDGDDYGDGDDGESEAAY